MGTRDSTPCTLGRFPDACCVVDVSAKLPKGLGGDDHNRLCPCHDDRRASLSVNPGNIQRLVWHCGAGCAAEDIRDALLGLGIDESCLGNYGRPKREVQPGMRIAGHDPGLVADAKRWHAAIKLPPTLSGKLLRMCLQAISEGDGDLPGDPARLLPFDRDGFVSLAGRSGIDPKYSYRLFRQWIDLSDAA